MPTLTVKRLEQAHERTERIYIRLGVKLFVALLLLIGLIWGGRVVVGRIKEGRLIQQAEASLAKGDKRWATIAARRVFEMNPSNPAASRILARIAESEGVDAAIEWRQQVLKAKPDSVEDAVALATSAVRFKRLDVAQAALDGAAASGGSNAAFHEARAQLAGAKGDHLQAASELAEAVRLDPANRLFQLKLAAAQLQSGAAETRAEATARLRSFLTEESLRMPAARALRDVALKERDAEGLLEASAVLYAAPDAEFADRISHVQLLRRLRHADFPARLTELQQEAEQTPARLFEVLSWMNSDDLAVFALDWLKRVPEEAIKQLPAALAVAETYGRVRDWPGLHEWCRNGNWRHLEFLRHSYLARAAREKRDDLGFRAAWGEAVKAVGASTNEISALQQQAAQWGWTAESADLLWLLAKDPSTQGAALSALYKHYAEAGSTHDLYRVVTRLLETKPDDSTLLNNFAQLSLLLGVNTARAHQLAEQLYQRDPRNAAIVSTCAYSSFLKRKPERAVEIMQSLTSEQLHQPEIAAYYGIVLSGAGQSGNAVEYLDLAERARLLPEEKAAVAKARNPR